MAHSGGRLFLLAALAWLAGPSAVHAHAIGLSCKILGERVEVAAFYDDGSKARDAAVLVQDATKQTIARGKTDSEGRWSFAVPADGQYRVSVDAGDGHRKSRWLRVGKASAADSSVAEIIEQGDDPDEFTRFPWLKLAIGVGAIVAVSAAYLIARRQARQAPPRQRAPDSAG